jgi:glucosamine--fructose-6-phosphate aminotransferase (isomerizing)
MCGIVAYIGSRPAQEFLLEGLRRLEYRGYDSAGMATVTADQRLSVVRVVGRIDQLALRLEQSPLAGTVGIGHTRWATHGAAVEENAHPHIGGNQVLALVHNGVIENYASLRTALEVDGYRFTSETDTEVVAHLVAAAVACPPAFGERVVATGGACRFGPTTRYVRFGHGVSGVSRLHRGSSAG